MHGFNIFSRHALYMQVDYIWFFKAWSHELIPRELQGIFENILIIDKPKKYKPIEPLFKKHVDTTPRKNII